MSNVLIIIQREFNERVRKKSFILTTVLVPLLLVAMMAVPTLLMLYTSSDTKEIAVIDESGLIMPALQSNEEIVYLPTEETLDEARAAARRVAEIMAAECGRDEAWIEAQVEAFTAIANNYIVS